ncbi:hypothetical protein PtrSN002B_000863 [Pyrenophora tritici-repentis]|uniref:DUF7624 domain-containing protein n=2 Tax=Pyrenophora tritici-repentis TaxID=45151 RepID=A0A2W1HRP6_9PLEO|nr:hypothetical protein A1F99_083170 [Pyrenophora tritici-repentis]KAI1511042.1 hypothetical protein Ptr86124_010163 [Pyrenophora tritici-repentis]KAI1530382.1 hypothetical protein PtrSN001A_008184 [Pyrenophora tritici-repentis]KAI1557873.1 hypothetical protein PtrSN002B_000863 [Pyrenophora tritici-repentis]KAI1576615.1 hypothetical protein PtrEW4_002070 [Pyrenophora tritici-repentis]
MATATQLMPSPSGLKSMSAFSPYTDSPSSPGTFAHVFSNRSSGHTSDHLQPPPSPYPATVDPSPVDSNGTSHTDHTEIEDDAQEDHPSEDGMSDIRSPATDDIVSPVSQDGQTKPHTHKLNTTVRRADSDDAPPSVIHAPDSFKQFSRMSMSGASSSANTSDSTAVVSPSTPEANMLPDVDNKHTSSTYTTPIDTAVSNSVAPDRSTPRAQTRQDFEEDLRRRSIRKSLNLADIAEYEDNATLDSSASSVIEQDDSQSSQSQDGESISIGTQTMGQAIHGIQETEKELAALRSALDECWTLCNSLAKLSQHHRTRMFHYSGGSPDMQEHAWRTCWRLCQKLYESREEDPSVQIRPTLELCRDFCQALFDVRQRGDEASDSVLRVSFELNNHLYNAHDRTLPETFRERTLDFYLTLCHRLMKQRTSLPEETDSLLHACWSLAEMLFSLRQNSRDGKPADEELLGSAIQACWDLCDLFREGWTQVRPDRGTPRPTQYAFSVGRESVSHRSQGTYSERSGRSSSVNESYHSAISARRATPMQPETPTTIFDDREEFSPADEPNVPNILVLGPEAGMTRTHDRWSSASSNLSTYSDASAHTSSTATAGREDPNLVRLKGLIMKAAINTGYNRQIPLPDFIRALPSNSFGTDPWQSQLFDNYRKLVLTDPTLRSIHSQPLRRLTALEIGRSVQWLGRSESFKWLRELYRFVFGAYPEDTSQRNLIINA